eukprot:Phypoly_transcript_13159.p1 GENE.Phypoly_transcript_13159~~Phypoly_transcript_13159.p1  ORF type:complete len:248 (-),score=11.01 Phypoly_transcript_13159:255-998(-)
METLNRWTWKALAYTRDWVYTISHWNWNGPIGEKRNDELVELRFKTSIKAAFAALLTFMFIVVPALRLAAHQHLYAVMQSVIVTLLVHQSLQGVMRNSFDVLQGGIVGCIGGCITWAISPNLYVSLAFFLIFAFFVGVYDPMLQRPLFMRISIWDFMVIVFFPVANQNYVDIPFMIMVHCTTLICAFIPFLLLWPNLSSRQFMREYRVCCGTCLALFQSLAPCMLSFLFFLFFSFLFFSFLFFFEYS